jgi:hypothetical protein
MIRYKGKHGGLWAILAASVRPVVLAVLAALIMLQGMGASSMRLAHRFSDQTLVSTAQGVTCIVDAHGDEAPPTPNANHVQCCILCCARDVNDGALACPVQANAHLFPSALGVAMDAWTPTLVRLPVGWASSWSSQAPPAFS